MLYAHYAFRDFLDPFQSSHKNSEIDPLVERLSSRLETEIENMTAEDVLSSLMGLAAVDYKNEALIETLITTHLIQQIPFVDHEILGLMAWVMGRLKPEASFQAKLSV